MIDIALITMLKAESTITNLVGTRIYFSSLEQNKTLPALVLNKISTFDRLLPHSGPIDMVRTRIQFSCIGKTPLESKTLAKAVREFLHGYTGTVSGVKIVRAEAQNEIDRADLDLGNMVSLDIVFTHDE